MAAAAVARARRPRRRRPSARAPRQTVARLQNRRPTCRRGCRCSGTPGWPRTDIELLDALATHHDLHLWLPHPSDALWQELAGVHGPCRAATTPATRVAQPLLATLGRDLRELQRSLPAGPESDEYLGAARPPDTLLGWLQSDITADAVRPGGRRPDDDRSVQVHSCHGPARQVDVLREVLLGLLADDPTLEPRDILVMCPDIETYAPLIVAGFGLGDIVPGVHPGAPAAGAARRPGR